MNDETNESYWPEELVDDTLCPPVAILNKVASELTARTSGILDGMVRYQRDEGSARTSYSFGIMARALDNFIYRLFTVTNDIELYPAIVIWEVGEEEITYAAGTPLELEQIIRKLLATPEVKKIVSSLVAQSRSARGA